MAIKRLMNEYKFLQKDMNPLFSVAPTEDFLVWNFIVFGPEDTFYDGGIFDGTIIFPNQYPNKPPTVKFNGVNMFHPNIYHDGNVCISILHEGTDTYGYESVGERWSPAQNINSIMLSIISMLSDPNFESPANTSASVLWKDKPDEYKEKIYALVRQTQNLV